MEQAKEKKRVLFVCTHNSARSQMAETFLNALGGDWFEAESAGLEPGQLNPLVIEVMREIGFDLTKNKVESVFEFYREGRLYDYVIYVCEKETETRCPVFPGFRRTLNWAFRDPAKLKGSHEEKLKETRKIRDEIKSQIESWLKEFN